MRVERARLEIDAIYYPLFDWKSFDLRTVPDHEVLSIDGFLGK